LKIYAGKEADAGQSVPTKVVMDLSNKLLIAGRTVVVDNFYTSIQLANKLLDRRTHLLGTLRANVIKAKLKKGEKVMRQNAKGITI
jgi:hypothetical protein